MGAENQDGARGDFADGFHKNGAAAPELLHNIGIVDNLMVYVDRSAIGFERQLNDVDRANHARAEPAGPDAKQSLSLSLWSHQFPKLLNLQSPIIPNSAF